MKNYIYELTTEYSDNPINIFTKTPRFGWKIKGEAGFTQQSYRILVSTTKEKLENQIYDLWDSGFVDSNSTINIVYGGKELNSKDRAFWKCIVIGKDKSITESNIKSFELTLLNEKDWNGRFISMPARDSGNAQYIRYEFLLPKKPISRGRVYMAGLGYSELYINGNKVDDRELSPAYTDYSKRINFVTYDITSLLKEEGNCLGIILGYGWLGDRKVKADLYVEFTDGTTYEAGTKHSLEWLISSGPIRSNSIYDGEIYDASYDDFIKGWNTYGYYSYYDNSWGFCINCINPGGKLEPEIIEPIKAVSSHECKLVCKNGNKYIYDVGINLAGWANIKVKGDKGTVFSIRYAERLNKAKQDILTLNLRTAKAIDTYICKGEGEEIYHPRFTYHGFQYIEINIQGKGTILEVKASFVGASCKRISKFDSSSQILNKLHQNVLITEQGNLHSVMTDCPQRDERYGWLNDWASRTYQNLNNFDMNKYYVKTLRDISDSIVDGMIGDTAPYNIGAQPADPVSAYLVLGLRIYERYGNIEPLIEHYDNMKGWVDYLYNRTKEGILEFSYYGDWVQPYENSEDESATTPKFYISTVFMFWQMKMLSKIAEIIGKEKDKEYYLKLSEKEREIINKVYYKENKGYASGSQTANALAIALNICDEESKKKLAKMINDDIVNRGYHITSGNIGYVHVFHVLTDFGYGDTLYKMVTNPDYPGWGFDIKQGATSIWERWEEAVDLDMVSFNHPMFSGIDSWFINKLAGIDIDKDCVGANSFAIKPVVLKDLDYVSSNVSFITGEVSSSWHKLGNNVIYNISIPTNTRARIEIKGNVMYTTGNFIEEFKEGDKTIYICLGGDYTFTV